jgi:hypothetical protein
MRGIAALIDISRSRRRGFAAAAALNSLLISALFGSLIPLPLYYQLVRHETLPPPCSCSASASAAP